MFLHRDSQKRFYGQDYVYFVVTKTSDNYPYFREPIFCELLIEELKICEQLKRFKLYAFSVICDHLNLLVQPGDEYNISKILQSIKKETARDINYIINYHKGHINKGDMPECRLQGEQYSRHYDQTFIVPKLSIFCHEFIKKYPGQPFPKFQWQKSFYSHVVANDSDFENHFNYTVHNPEKHNLPADWQYSSLHYPELVEVSF